ncbi:MAG: hypothetical protein ACOCP4_04290, partial [Candidatus Woesearchaeota archaeon]
LNKDLKILETYHFVIKQVYDNRPLMETAYYAEKRPYYTKLMQGRTAKKVNLGIAMRKLQAMITKYNIKSIFAYNAPFDKRAIKFTTDFFKVKNPTERTVWHDIMSLANHQIHNTKEYKEFCIENNYITPKGYIKTGAETTYEFLSGRPFAESHIGIQDAYIENEILKNCKDIFKHKKKKFIRA